MCCLRKANPKPDSGACSIIILNMTPCLRNAIPEHMVFAFARKILNIELPAEVVSGIMPTMFLVAVFLLTKMSSLA